MKVLVTGALGQLGREVVCELEARGHESCGLDIRPGEIRCAGARDGEVLVTQADIGDASTVSALVDAAKPDAIVHCAAWTNVDAAEDPANRTDVWQANVEGTRNLARTARIHSAKMLYVSSDYVFGSQEDRPLQPDDTCTPCNAYGLSKLEGEQAMAEELDRFFVVRTSWLFGPHGKNFVDAIAHAGNTRDEVRVVDDQVGTPTFAPDLARLLVDMVETDKYGIYHATNAEARPQEYISWYDFAREIFKRAGCTAKLVPVSTAEYGLSKAKRPSNSRLDKTRLIEAGFEPLPDWKSALERHLEHHREAW